MAGNGSAIRAGQAFVEIFTDKSAAVRGLNSFANDFKSWGKGLSKAGAFTLGGAAAISAPLVASVKMFADAGSALNDMSARTGVAVESLSTLKFAAEQNGSSLESLEGSIKKYQRTQSEALTGNKEAAQGFAMVGLNAGQLARLPVDEQLARIGERLAMLPEGMHRTAAAMALFGRSGTDVLPMLTQLRQDMDRAKSLGLPWTTAEAAKADALGDRWDELKAVAIRTAQVIGGELAPAVMDLSEPLLAAVIATKKFIAANPGVVETTAMVAAGLGAAGAALTALGVTSIIAGAGLSAVASGFVAVGAVAGAVFSPIGLTVAAIAGIGIVVAKNTDAFGGLKETAVTSGNAMQQSWTGVRDAIAGHDLGLAGQIAMAGLNVAFQAGSRQVLGHWYMLTADLQSAWSSVWVTIEGVIDGAVTSIARKMLTINETMTGLKFDAGITIGVNTQAEKSAAMGQLRQTRNEFEKEAQGRAAGIKKGGDDDAAMIEAQRNVKLAKSEAELIKSQNELAALTEKAAKKRKEIEEKQRGKTKSKDDSGESAAESKPSKATQGTMSGLVASLNRGAVEGPVSRMNSLGDATDNVTGKFDKQTEAIKRRNVALNPPAQPAVAVKQPLPAAPPQPKPKPIDIPAPEMKRSDDEVRGNLKKRGRTDAEIDDMPAKEFEAERSKLEQGGKIKPMAVVKPVAPAAALQPSKDQPATTADQVVVSPRVAAGKANAAAREQRSTYLREKAAANRDKFRSEQQARADKRWQERYEKSGKADLMTKEEFVTDETAKERGQYRNKSRTESFSEPGAGDGFGEGQFVPRGAGLKLPEKDTTNKRGRYLRDANAQLTEQTGGYGLGERLAAGKSLRERMGYQPGTPISTVVGRHREEYQDELKANRDKALLAGKMPSLELRNQAGGESFARGDLSGGFQPGQKTKSGNQTPQQRAAATLDNRIAQADQQRREALATADAMRGIAAEPKAAPEAPTLIKTPQQALGVASDVQANPVDRRRPQSQPQLSPKAQAAMDREGIKPPSPKLAPLNPTEPEPLIADNQPIERQTTPPAVTPSLDLSATNAALDTFAMRLASVDVQLPDFSGIRDTLLSRTSSGSGSSADDRGNVVLTEIRDAIKSLESRVAAGASLTA